MNVYGQTQPLIQEYVRVCEIHQGNKEIFNTPSTIKGQI